MRDQTQAEWLKGMKSEDLGLGLVLVGVPAPRDVEKARVWDVTYDGMRAIAETALAFRWIPYRIRPRDALAEEIVRVKCGGACQETCVHVGCLCHEGRCV